MPSMKIEGCFAIVVEFFGKSTTYFVLLPARYVLMCGTKYAKRAKMIFPARMAIKKSDPERSLASGC